MLPRSWRSSGSPPVNEKNGICASRRNTWMTRFDLGEAHGEARCPGRRGRARPAAAARGAAARVAEPAGVVARVGDGDLPEDGQAREIERVGDTLHRRAVVEARGVALVEVPEVGAELLHVRGPAPRRRCRGIGRSASPRAGGRGCAGRPRSPVDLVGRQDQDPVLRAHEHVLAHPAEEAVDPGEVADGRRRSQRSMRPPRHAGGVAGGVAGGMAGGVARVVAGGMARVVARGVAGSHAAGLRLAGARSSP